MTEADRASGAALIALQAQTVDNAVDMASAMQTTETNWPSSLLQSCHTKLFCPVQTLKIQKKNLSETECCFAPRLN